MTDSNPMLEHALRYAENGWRVFALAEKSKVPNKGTSGLHEATTDPAQIVQWWTESPKANIGLRGGSGICVVDADVKNGKDGVRVLEAMDIDLDTLSVCTPSGGRHFYYRTGENFVNSQGALDGIDVRSEGAYVLAPPSVVDGREYEWLDEGLVEIADMPAELADTFRKFDCHEDDAPETYDMDIDPPTDEEVGALKGLYAKFLTERAKPAVEGDAGHSALLFAAIKGVHGFRLPKSEVVALLWEHFNPRCQPEWDYGNMRERYEFERKVTEALKLTPKRIVCELSRLRKTTQVATIKDRIHYYAKPSGQGVYYFRRDDGQYQPMSEATLKRHLRRFGVETVRADDEEESEAETILLDCQLDKLLSFAGNIAGYDSGIHTKRGVPFLSLRSPITVEAKEGDWSMLRQVLVGLFVDGDNLNRFLAWMYWSWLYLHEREWAPLPVLALAGPKNCGKSLAVEILARVLGDTEKGQALGFISGETKFNADLAGSHLLVVDDEISTMDMRSRRSTGQRIKSLAVLNDHRIEAKGFDAQTLSPHWRCIFATNDEPESLQVLPIVDDGLEDKLLLLRCKRTEMPMVAKTPKQRKAFMRALLDEIPAMLHELSESDWVEEYGDTNRMAVEGWQDPVLLDSLRSFDAHRQLLDLIDILKPWDVIDRKWEGTAAELEGMLKSDQGTSRASEKVLSWTNACGTYLGRLAHESEPRVFRAKPERDRRWIIYGDNAPGL